MKILALSDQVVESIYSADVRDRFGDVDLLLSCGDLPYSYLEYVVTLLGAPAFYVHGNHDQPEDLGRGTLLTEPRGWVNLDRRTVRVGPLLLAGLEGALRYRPNAPFQYTEWEMRWKVVRLLPALLLNRMRYGRYLDILVTHAPPLGIHNDVDLPHRGFAVFRWLMERFRPRYLLHGHKHVYKPQATRTRYRETVVVNVYPFAVLEW
ncbi:MAG: metallophosphoesterase [Anaerolineae bacterium]|jgi:Icc-related predicted phosphoesterase